MSEAVLIALITGGLAVLSNVIIALNTNSKTIYRINQLEKKVEKHNNLIERMALVEQDNRAQWRRIDEINEILKEGEE